MITCLYTWTIEGRTYHERHKSLRGDEGTKTTQQQPVSRPQPRQGPEAPTRCPLDHDASPAPRGRRRRGTEGDPYGCPHLDAAARHVHDFAETLHHFRRDQLPDWMERVLADDLPALHSLVSGLRRDFDAVTAGLSTSWSSGQVEGQVTRVKLLKRRAYGRANLDLLRQRVLLGP
ncbi:transposase [Streptomyces sp. DSM 3412]|uniref:Transposase n=1 Tax=Streptomyces gottesmaniae TaxID=3075518 RepID=A0ABU2Z8A6_9ACTN|nr:transposase [Streptomyces sp. DSM 3412]MDT0572803.1 transposase [Streptomyces sp. DSM 3412]